MLGRFEQLLKVLLQNGFVFDIFVAERRCRLDDVEEEPSPIRSVLTVKQKVSSNRNVSQSVSGQQPIDNQNPELVVVQALLINNVVFVRQ